MKRADVPGQVVELLRPLITARDLEALGAARDEAREEAGAEERRRGLFGRRRSR